MIADTGRNQRHASPHLLFALERCLEEVTEVSQFGDCGLAGFHTVGTEFLTSEAKQFQRRYTVASKKPMQRVGTCVSRLSRITDEELPAAPSQDERGAQARGSAADDDDVEHRRLNCKATAIARAEGWQCGSAGYEPSSGPDG